MTSTSSAYTALVLAPHSIMQAPTGPNPSPSVRGTDQRVCLLRRLDACGRRLRLRLGLVVLVLMLLLAVSALGQTSDAVQFVFAFNHDVSAQLGSTTIDPAERKRRFAALVDEDSIWMSSASVCSDGTGRGRHWPIVRRSGGNFEIISSRTSR
jgi:hypothetical protein